MKNLAIRLAAVLTAIILMAGSLAMCARYEAIRVDYYDVMD